VGTGLFNSLAVDCKYDADSKEGMEHELLAGLSVPECWTLDNVVDDRPCVN
jgi:hypothetical protein